MVDFRNTKWFSPVFILLLIFPSCAQMKSRLSPQPSVQTPQQSVQTPQQSVQTPQPSVQTPQASSQTRGQAQRYVTAGEYQKAIDLYKTEYKKNPQDSVFVKEYVKSLEEIKASADGASEKKDFELAGKTYNILLKNYPDFKRFAGTLSFDSAILNSKLTNCKTALSNKGFQAYREGNLSEAISLWQDYLEIDPNNTNIRKTLNTAKIQQKNLQQTK